MKNRDVANIGLMILAGTGLAAFAYSQTNRLRTPEYDHETPEKDGNIEIREYGSAIVAQVEIEGPRIQAIDRGFDILADYIFGENTENVKIAMTTPVLQQGEYDKWTVQFVMPEHYTLDTLPLPTNPLIAIREIPERQVAVIRFRGSSKRNAYIAGKTKELGTYIAEEGLHITGEPQLAFYDPPWTLPFLRRNEVMIELKTKKILAEKPTITERPKLVSKPKLAKKG